MPAAFATGVPKSRASNSFGAQCTVGNMAGWTLLLAAAVTGVVGCTPSPPGTEDPQPGRANGAGGGEDASSMSLASALTLEQAMAEYTRWTPRQDAPRAVSAEILSLCRLPSLPEQAFTESVHGDSLALRDWANELAVQGLQADEPQPFPVGAAIVKQKFSGAELIALGVMVKRASGYDSVRGDWEFGYWEHASGLSSGPEAARVCGGCHAGAKTDYVFTDSSWRMP